MEQGMDTAALVDLLDRLVAALEREGVADGIEEIQEARIVMGSQAGLNLTTAKFSLRLAEEALAKRNHEAAAMRRVRETFRG